MLRAFASTRKNLGIVPGYGHFLPGVYWGTASISVVVWEGQWPDGLPAGLRIEGSVFEPYQGHLCFFLGRHVVEMSTGKFKAGGNPAMD